MKILNASIVALIAIGTAVGAPMDLKPIVQPLTNAIVKGEPQRCGDYFFAFPAIDGHGPIINYLIARPTEEIDGITERDQFKVMIDPSRIVPSVEFIRDPQGIEGRTVILRIAQRHYDQAKACLPPPG